MDAQQMVERLVEATNAHDLDALVACFGEDYVNETPIHPGRRFRGRDQVRKNWERIFSFVPDIQAEVIRLAVDGETVWSEWEMTGTRLDGSAHRMRGVIVFGVTGGTASWARFFLEPVDDEPGDVDQAVLEQVARS